MKAFIVMPEDSIVEDGLVDFLHELGSPIVHPSLHLAMQELMTAKVKVKILEFEFLFDGELLEAVNSTNMGSHMHKYHVKWLAVYERKQF